MTSNTTALSVTGSISHTTVTAKAIGAGITRQNMKVAVNTREMGIRASRQAGIKAGVKDRDVTKDRMAAARVKGMVTAAKVMVTAREIKGGYLC